MSWFRNREGKETENPDVKPRNQILQTPESNDSDAKKKLDNGDNKQSFEDRIKVKPSDMNKEQPEKKKLDSSSDDTNIDSRTGGRDIPSKSQKDEDLSR